MGIVWRDYEIADPPVAGEARVREVERELGVRLPEDYVEVARENQGRAPSPATVSLGESSKTVLGYLLHFEAEPQYASLVGAWRAIRDALPEGVIPFAEDPAGNFFCFDYRADEMNPPVVFWPHEQPERMIPVAAGFNELLDMLVE